MRTRKSRSLANQAEADAGVDMARTKKQPAGKKRQLTQLYKSSDAKKLRPSLSRSSEEPERDPEGETGNGDAGIVQPVEGPPARVAGSSEAGETASRSEDAISWTQRLQDDAALQLQKAKNEKLKLKLQVKALLHAPWLR